MSSFLVSRVNISVGRYNEARGNLEVMYRESRELMQNASIFSNHLTNNVAKEWRLAVAYRCMLLLRTSMAVINYGEYILVPLLMLLSPFLTAHSLISFVARMAQIRPVFPHGSFRNCHPRRRRQSKRLFLFQSTMAIPTHYVGPTKCAMKKRKI